MLTAFLVDTMADEVDVNGFISLREAVLAANSNTAVGDAPAGMSNGDTIRFAPTLLGSTITLTMGELPITEDLDIDGQLFDVSLAAGSSQRIFNINTNEAVNLSNLTLTGGDVADEGGAIAIAGGGVTTIQGVSISDSTASGDGGGAIFVLDSTVNISGSVISGNTADGVSGSGGGLLIASGSVSITGGQISGNSAVRAGGGIEIIDGQLTLDGVDLGGATTAEGNLAGYTTTGNPGNGGGLHVTGIATVELIGGTVQNNFAASEGGGLWNQAGSTLTVRNGAQVSNNTASGDSADNGGGGIFNNGGTLIVTDSTIANNIADGAAGSGGGVFSTAGSVSITSSQISGNSAVRAGGGIEIIDGQLILDGVDLGGATTAEGNLAGSTTTGNPGNGGGLHVSGIATVDVIGGTVQNNFAASEGGGLWNQVGSTLTVRNGTQVSNNIASGDDADNGGGGIFNNGGTLIVTGSTIANNIADGAAGSGGGVFSTAGSVSITSSQISGNSAVRAGGGIEIIDGQLILIDVDLGGATTAEGNLAGSTTTGNPGNGGGLHVSNIATIDIIGGTVQNNFAASEGGGLWNQVGSTLTVRNGTQVSNNTASGDDSDNGGGGIFNNGGTLIVTGSTIANNIADGTAGSGGGVFSTSGSVTIANTLIDQNVANRAGGGIEIIDGSLVLRSSQLTANVAGPQASAAPGNGGGLHVSGNSAQVKIHFSQVLDNIAASEGGGLWNQLGSEMTVFGSGINDNLAQGDAADDGGGGIFNNGGTLTIGRSKIYDNIADGAAGSGGGVFSTSGDVTLVGVRMNGNVANRAGGGIEVIDGNLSLQSVLLTNNIAGPQGSAAPGNGGGLHVSGANADVDVLFSRVIGNVAAQEGGGLWNQAGSTMSVENSNILRNTASGDAADDGGGGIFNNGGTLDILRSVINENNADGNAGSGGGLFTTAGDVSISHSRIDGNVANRAGGGIEVIDGQVALRSLSLRNNVAGPQGSASPGNGGGLHVSGGNADINILFSQISGNEAALEGGGLWNQAGSTLSVITSTISGNRALGTASDDGGGGIFNNGGVVDLIFARIDDNFAAGNGGGIFNLDGGQMTIRASNIVANQADGNGGGIYNDGDLEMLFAFVRRNDAGDDGGGIFTDSNGVTDLALTQLFDNSPNDLAGPGTVV